MQRDSSWEMHPFTAKTLRRERSLFLIILVGLSIVLTYLHYYWIDAPYSQQRWEEHRDIFARDAPSPYRYRILVPYLAEAMGRLGLITTGFELRKGVLLGYLLIHFLSVFLGLSLFYNYLRRWFVELPAQWGTLFVAAMFPLTYIHYFMQPTSHPEFVFFTAGMGLILDRRLGWLWMLLVVSTLLRETSVFLVLLAFLCNLGRMSTTALAGWTGIFTVTWVGVYGGLRILLGPAAHIHSADGGWTAVVLHHLRMNFTTWDTFLTVPVFFGALWWLACANASHKPAVLRRALWFVPAFFLVHLTFSRIHEVRFFLELCPVIIPLALMSLPGMEPSTASFSGEKTRQGTS